MRRLPKRFAAPADLAAEPEDVKALRLLRALRYFVEMGGQRGVATIVIDGQTIFLVKYFPPAMPTADTTSDVEA